MYTTHAFFQGGPHLSLVDLSFTLPLSSWAIVIQLYKACKANGFQLTLPIWDYLPCFFLIRKLVRHKHYPFHEEMFYHSISPYSCPFFSTLGTLFQLFNFLNSVLPLRLQSHSPHTDCSCVPYFFSYSPFSLPLSLLPITTFRQILSFEIFKSVIQDRAVFGISHKVKKNYLKTIQ